MCLLHVSLSLICLVGPPPAPRRARQPRPLAAAAVGAELRQEREANTDLFPATAEVEFPEEASRLTQAQRAYDAALLHPHEHHELRCGGHRRQRGRGPRPCGVATDGEA